MPYRSPSSRGGRQFGTHRNHQIASTPAKPATARAPTRGQRRRRRKGGGVSPRFETVDPAIGSHGFTDGAVWDVDRAAQPTDRPGDRLSDGSASIPKASQGANAAAAVCLCNSSRSESRSHRPARSTETSADLGRCAPGCAHSLGLPYNPHVSQATSDSPLRQVSVPSPPSSSSIPSSPSRTSSLI
jgi:hypothetical protein